MIVAVAVEPDDRHPLRFALQPVDFADQLAISSLFVAVDDDHVEKVTVDFLHFAGLFDYFFQIVVLKYRKSVNYFALMGKQKYTLTASPLSRFLARNFSSEGGATKTTKGIRFDSLSILRDCGCRLRTQNFPAETTVRMASSVVP